MYGLYREKTKILSSILENSEFRAILTYKIHLLNVASLKLNVASGEWCMEKIIETVKKNILNI